MTRTDFLVLLIFLPIFFLLYASSSPVLDLLYSRHFLPPVLLAELVFLRAMHGLNMVAVKCKFQRHIFRNFQPIRKLLVSFPFLFVRCNQYYEDLGY